MKLARKRGDQVSTEAPASPQQFPRYEPRHLGTQKPQRFENINTVTFGPR